MSLKKSVLAFILVYIQVVTLLAAPPALSQPSRFIAQQQTEGKDLDAKSKDSHSLVMDIPTAQGNAQLSYTEIPLEDPSQLGELLQREQIKNADILLSTDVPEIYESVAEAVQKTQDNTGRKFRFMPIGKLAASGEKLATTWDGYKKNVRETLKFDKIGLSIMVVTTAYDSFIWVHSGSLDVYQKSAMVMLNVIFVAAFGLDRDMWTKMTVPLRHRIMNGLDKISKKVFGREETEAGYARRVLASQFLSNLAYGTGFQILRVSIMSFHDLATNVMTSHFWATSMKVAVITTLASFAWSELMAAANSDKHPVAKNALKRLADVRSIVMSQLASMGMVLQPGVYGYSPIVAIVTSGAIGLLALVKSNKVINWLEKNRVSNILFKSQRKFETIVNDAANYLKFRRSTDITVTPTMTKIIHDVRSAGGNSCSMLFN
jgi:hypothetical protein